MFVPSVVSAVSISSHLKHQSETRVVWISDHRNMMLLCKKHHSFQASNFKVSWRTNGSREHRQLGGGFRYVHVQPLLEIKKGPPSSVSVGRELKPPP